MEAFLMGEAEAFQKLEDKLWHNSCVAFSLEKEHAPPPPTLVTGKKLHYKHLLTIVTKYISNDLSKMECTTFPREGVET